MLGGAFFTNGNVNPAAEANIFGDPEAADVVFSSQAKMRVASLASHWHRLHTCAPLWPCVVPKTPSSPDCSKDRVCPSYHHTSTYLYTSVFNINLRRSQQPSKHSKANTLIAASMIAIAALMTGLAAKPAFARPARRGSCEAGVMGFSKSCIFVCAASMTTSTQAPSQIYMIR